ncbi:TlpA family protein disulfide reductase [Ideonella oryzae]|uniref:TlpA family protein disulfide reductase n=1 Tax=Ideonella oryzae TaxID=2937441 RepID=A0ABT1BPE7_9BURK|nr:TlpA disulfide reductase family protein [Ideonella oryzae]MCO5978093.1 TlpA family protein disulfide reductase [Ideonella oryzae]
MSSSLQIGPFTLPWALLLMVLAVLAGNTLGRRVGRAQGIDPEAQAFRVLLLALLAARLAFVWPYRGLYLGEPWRLIDIRDGGWNAQAGLIAGWIATAWWVQRHPPLRRPLLASVGAASLVWLVGSGLLLWQRPTDPQLPALTLNDLQNQPVALAQFRGQPTVVNLWATWCPPCRREMPVLAAAQSRYPGVRFVFVNQGESAATVQAYLASQGLHLDQVLIDPRSELGARLGQRALPTTLFLDTQGQVVTQRIGELSPATLADKLGALGPPSPPSTPPSTPSP